MPLAAHGEILYMDLAIASAWGVARAVARVAVWVGGHEPAGVARATACGRRVESEFVQEVVWAAGVQAGG